MANTLLTPTMVTREALRILHQNLNFVGTVNRQYDDSFAQTGAKIGDTLKIRLPNQYTVRTGATLSAQDTAERSTDLVVGTQKGVDVNFTSAELTLDLDDFSRRILEPAMAVLAANVEADAMLMYQDVYNDVTDVGGAATSAQVLAVGKTLTDNLAPVSQRCMNMQTGQNADLVEALKGLFNDPAKISENYREGMVANDFLGFRDVYQNTLWPRHTSGSDNGAGLGTVNGAGQTGSAITVGGTSAGFKKGDTIVFGSGALRVHPETKLSTGKPQRFVVTADFAGGAGTLNISPAIVTTGALQNVDSSPADSATILKVEADGSTAIAADASYDIGMGYHQDAFAFATADLVMPRGVDFAAREVQDGLSLRVVRQYDINNDKFPCRIDILYGYKTIRPEIACRMGNN